MYRNKKEPDIAPIFYELAKNFEKNTYEFKENDIVILSPIARKWDEVKYEGLIPNKEYTISSATPMMPCAGGNQQFVSIFDTKTDLSYPSWCFIKI
jgi:hypothetical protein